MKPIKTGDFLLSCPYGGEQLLRRLSWCGTPAAWGWEFCRLPSCHRCRKYRVKAWIDEAIDAFSSSRFADLRFVTVMLQPLADVDAIKPTIDKGKVALRNIVYRMRTHDARAHDIRMIGASEVDWYYPHHTHRLSSYKRTQLDSLGFDKTASDVWMPHFHLIVDLARTPEHHLTERLHRKWPGFRQVDIRPLDSSRTLESNVTRLLSYSTKHKHYYKIDPFRAEAASFVRWCPDAIVAYHNALFRSGGFSMLRVHLKPTRPAPVEGDTDDADDWHGAMPFTLAVSENAYFL